MVGRACINHPYMWINTDKLMYKDENQETLSRGEIIVKYANYCESIEKIEKFQNSKIDTSTETELYNLKTSSKVMLAPVYNLFTGEKYCDQFRRDLLKMSSHVTSPSLILRSAIKQIPPDVLHGRRGEYRENDEIIIYDKMKKSSGPMKSRIS